MKASILIKCLEALIREWGNRDIYVTDGEGKDPKHISDICTPDEYLNCEGFIIEGK